MNRDDPTALEQDIRYRYSHDPVFQTAVEEGIYFALKKVLVPGNSQAIQDAARWAAGAALLAAEELPEGVELITPEQINRSDVPGYDHNYWNYPVRCKDVVQALGVIKEKIQEWSLERDPNGWWHERPYLIALHNEVVRLRKKESKCS